MELGSRLNTNDFDGEMLDIYERLESIERDHKKIKRVQDDQALFFALLMKKYNVTIDEIRAEGKALC